MPLVMPLVRVLWVMHQVMVRLMMPVSRVLQVMQATGDGAAGDADGGAV